MEILRLMADYNCSPLWISGKDGLRNMESDDLPLDQELKSSIDRWADAYSLTFDAQSPVNSDFSSIELQRNFVRQGYNIALRLSKKFDGRYQVEYFDYTLHKYINIHAEL